MHDLSTLSVRELDQRSIRTGCETEENRQADLELRRRGYVFNAPEARWELPLLVALRALEAEMRDREQGVIVGPAWLERRREIRYWAAKLAALLTEHGGA